MMKVLLAVLLCVSLVAAAEYGAPLYDEEMSEMGEEMIPRHMGYSLHDAEGDAPSFPSASSFLEEESAPRPRHNLLRNRKHDRAPQFHPSLRHLKKQQPITGANPVGTYPRRRFSCKGGGCERAVGGRLRRQTGTPSNPAYKIDKLSVAFQAVKEEIMNRALELRNERKWSKAVKQLIRNYRTKSNKVGAHVKELKREAKNLLRKKKQIQNAQIQKKLTSKLRLAQADMALLQKQLTHINNKESEFAATESNLRETMRQLQLHLRKLKGAKPPKVQHHAYKV